MRFPGIIPAVTTPFHADGAVDALQSNINALLDAGVHGVVGTGTMGEAGSLSSAERREVIAAIAEAVDGRVPVIAGVSAATPALAIGHASDAAAAGAVAIMCLPPLGYHGDDREIEAFYASVAQAAGLPLMVYNNPEASGVDMRAELIARIRAHVEHVVADVAPAECVALYEHCRAGELESAREVYRRLLPLARFDMKPKLVQYFKAAMDEVGLVGGATRAPRLPLDDHERDELHAALTALRTEVAA
jgi:dihydrodipicolinate synthase/N-acetylneuraminate lyase